MICTWIFSPSHHTVHRPWHRHGARHLHGVRGGRIGHHEETAEKSVHGQARQRAPHFYGLRADRNDSGWLHISKNSITHSRLAKPRVSAIRDLTRGTRFILTKDIHSCFPSWTDPRLGAFEAVLLLGCDSVWHRWMKMSPNHLSREQGDNQSTLGKLNLQKKLSIESLPCLLRVVAAVLAMGIIRGCEDISCDCCCRCGRNIC